MNLINCLIYKGYGERVSQRLHAPKDINFALELGLKDINLVLGSAAETTASPEQPGG